jgi:hypothetical protein
LARFFRKEAALVFAAGYQTNLGVISALVGRKEDGRVAAKKVLELYPSFSLEQLSKALPFKNRDFFRLFVGALREAGLE